MRPLLPARAHARTSSTFAAPPPSPPPPSSAQHVSRAAMHVCDGQTVTVANMFHMSFRLQDIKNLHCVHKCALSSLSLLLFQFKAAKLIRLDCVW